MIGELALLLSRQVIENGTQPDEEASTSECQGGNDYDGRLGVRISAIFVILITSSLGELNTFQPPVKASSQWLTLNV